MIGFQQLQYFRIPFVQALDLVGRRQVFLQNGMAYVPQSQLVSIIVARFRMSLSRALLQVASTDSFLRSPKPHCVCSPALSHTLEPRSLGPVPLARPRRPTGFPSSRKTRA